MLSPKHHSFTANRFHDSALVLSDGRYWLGKSIGIPGLTKGEICFNVNMTGYQEIITDPSYAEQIITFTFPHIGNTGCNFADDESRSVFCRGIVLRGPVQTPSNFRTSHSLEQWLQEQAVVGIAGVDTRALTANIREFGPRSALLYCGEPGETISLNQLREEVQDHPTLEGRELSQTVTTLAPYSWQEGSFQLGQEVYSRHPKGRRSVVVMDFGVKRNILRHLVESGLQVTVVPAQSSLEQVLALSPDGIFLSNGPGDPFATYELTRHTLAGILERNIPLFGICLGHQLLALASGLTTLKLHRGHRGGNHPVLNLHTGRVEITSQNHGFYVSGENLPPHVEITHRSLFDHTIEGIRLKNKPAFAVQYHPESSPGPHDSHYLFAEFYRLIEEARGNSHA